MGRKRCQTIKPRAGPPVPTPIATCCHLAGVSGPVWLCIALFQCRKTALRGSYFVFCGIYIQFVDSHARLVAIFYNPRTCSTCFSRSSTGTRWWRPCTGACHCETVGKHALSDLPVIKRKPNFDACKFAFLSDCSPQNLAYWPANPFGGAEDDEEQLVVLRHRVEILFTLSLHSADFFYIKANSSTLKR